MNRAYSCITSLFVVCLGSATFTMAQTLRALTTVTVNGGSLSSTVTPNTLYLANFGSNNLQIYDVANPASPILRGTFDNNVNQRIRSVEVNGSIAYITCFGTGSPSSCKVQAVNISSSTAPNALSSVTLPGGPASVASAGSLVCITTQVQAPNQDMLYVYDTSLNRLGAIATGGNPLQVVLRGTLAYVVDRQYNTLQIFDVSTPTTPRLVSSVSTGASPSSVVVDGTLAYVNDAQGVRTFDVTNPAAPVVRATTPAVSLSVIAGSYGYGVQNGKLQAYSLPATGVPTLLAEVSVGGSVTNISASGTTIYVIDQLRVQVFQFLPVATSVTAAKNATFHCFPNPTSGEQVQVELPLVAHAQAITVYNTLGQVIRKLILPAGTREASLDLRGVTKGIYVVKSGEGMQKLVLE